MGMIENFEAMLARGQDSALLRFSLGIAFFNIDAHERAVVHLARAVAYDPGYSAAWKIYGRALAALGRERDALAAFDTGIAAAEAKGDIQAAKEMRVFRKRVARHLEPGA